MTKIAECYTALTGRETSPESLKKAGERICTVNKIINVREGFSRVDDQVPAWMTPIDAPDGLAVTRDYYHRKTISREDLECIISDYYDERGWDLTMGIPTKRKLAELGLDQYATEGVPD